MTARPPEFDDTTSSWNTYRVRLEAFFEGHSITNPGKQRALLVSALSDNVVRVLQGQCQSESVNHLSYEAVVQHLDNHFDPQVNEIAASYAFFMRNQAEGEKVRDYITDLRRLAKDCSFDKFLDRMLRDRIVCGIRDEQARRHTLSQKKLTLAEAEAFALAAETAETNVRAMQERRFNDNGAANFIQKHRINPQKSGRGHGSMTEATQCPRCGSNHVSEVCRHKKATCYKCGRKGHLARMCSSGRANPSGTYAVKELDGSDESGEEMLYALVAHSYSSNESARPFERDFIWEGRKLRMLVDTGSTISVIPRTVFENHREWWPTLEKTSLRLTCFLGPLPVLGRVAMKVECDNTQVDSSLVVVDCDGPLLCGRNTIQAFRSAGIALLDECAPQSVNVVHCDAETAKLLAKFPDIFEEKLGCCKGPPVKLHKKEAAVPRFLKARPVPYALREKVSAEIDRQVQEGVLSPVRVSEWATPVVPVVKRNGDIRLCGDFKLTVNQATHLEQYPLPKIEDIFASLYGGELFTTLDLRHAYNQLPLDDEAREMAVLNTHKGLFAYNRLAFGIASAPALFQRRLESVLQGLPRVKVYLDDIIIAEKQNDNSTLRQVLERLRDNGLKLNRDKCRFREKQVSFLGHKIDATGLHPPENMEAITEAPRPETVSQLKSFLGLLTYYAKFLPNLATTLVPLYRLLAKGVRWQWKAEHEKAFQAAKRAMVAAELLVHYDPEKPLRLECDASPVGVGAVLSHRIGNTDYPISFRSRALTPAERNYSQLEKEALALVFGVTKFRDYLLAKHFTLVTDHKPLTGLFHPERPIPHMAAARIQRWALLLSAYHYDLEYRQGQLNANADALSRLPLPCLGDRGGQEPMEYVLYTRSLNSMTLSAQHLAELSRSDDTLHQIRG
nr:uncharacterized protein LOC126537393 [Dermacentor andersoni]